MLDADTKRRIDTARDILVGKVPDPKSQVEQITIALIYKFMDDIDAESEEFGGERNFFAGEFARYGWSKLIGPGVGGHETLNLYAEAIARMPENPGIPPLFRSIFNNAYLPYRDPETLRAFLKVIDEFTYDHSERLGDAFEYLLSVLGSQGDAGQFRTPRHIIDFMVAVVDPKKNETVLDPACGTAGFLISSYKHILAANVNEDGQSTLTPDDLGRLPDNFKGYDISPDMVRLSLVNLYLHGFREPHIHEYDTLTSEDRWNEFADVILANPPFMSPKGGIRPHNRFSVQSRRSEVLFVDYMAEHLKANGRAGIIVPEGIIFQSQKAYKQLRKMLVEDYLVAVVSLPAGVFNPYSGVKTSILILDRALAKRTESIAFFKVENDGFDLGAQRRPIEMNDLLVVQEELTEYLSLLRAGGPVGDFQPASGMVVGKERIAADGEYNLSGERYRETKTRPTKWSMVALSEIVDIESGSRQKGGALASGIPSVGGEHIDGNGSILFQGMKFVSEDHFLGMKKGILRKGDVLVVKDGATTGKTGIFIHDIEAAVNEHVFILRANESVNTYFLYSVVRSSQFQETLKPFIKGIIGGISLEIRQIKVPLPPLDVQREIVAEIEGYQRVIDGARAVVENYRPRIEVDPGWPMVALGEITQPQYGFTASAQSQGDARFIRITDINEEGSLNSEEQKFIALTTQAEQSILEKGDILVARTGATYGKTVLFDKEYPAVFASYLIRLRFPADVLDPYYYWAFAQTDCYWDQAKTLMTGGGQPQFNGNAIKQIRLPLAPLAAQRAIVAELQAEQAVVEANRDLIRRFEGKIEAVIGRVWGSTGVQVKSGLPLYPLLQPGFSNK